MNVIPWLGSVAYPTAQVRRNYDVTLGKMLQPDPASDRDIETHYVKAAAVQWSGVIVNSDITMWANPNEIRSLRLAPGDLLVCEGGDVGRTALYEGSEGNVIFQNSVHRVRALAGGDVRYLRYVLIALHASQWLDVICNKATIRHFTAEKLAALDVPSPPGPEQRRIANFLDSETARLDKLVCLRQTDLELMRERREAEFSELVSAHGGPVLTTLDPSDTEAFRALPLSRVLRQLTNGYVGPTRDLFVDDPGVKYLQSLHIKDGRIDFLRRPYYVPETWAAERPRIGLRLGDLLIVQTGAIGEVAVVDEEFEGSSCHALLIARPDSSTIAPDYLYHVLRSGWGKQVLLREQTGALHPHLEAGKVREIRVPVPALPVQRVIVDTCRSAEIDWHSVQTGLLRQIALILERKQALIAAAVTGQFDVTTGRGVDLS